MVLAKGSYRLCFFVISGSGIASITLLGYGILSPHWFLISPRGYSANPATRVLGLQFLLEKEGNKTNTSSLGEFEEANKFPLITRREWVCDYDTMHARHKKKDAALKAQGKPTEEELKCGIDCQDITYLSQVEVPCSNSKPIGAFPIPVEPAYRLKLSTKPEKLVKWNLEQQPRLTAGKKLQYDCKKKKSWSWWGDKCPVGFRACYSAETASLSCPQGGTKKACCIDTSQVGDTLYNVNRTPSYVQVFGWAEWEANAKLNKTATKDRWCDVKKLRCGMLVRMEENGNECRKQLAVAMLFMLIGVCLSMINTRNRTIPLILLAFVGGAGISTFTVYEFRAKTAAVLKEFRTDRDEFGRTFVHPMKDHDPPNPELMSAWIPSRDLMTGWQEKFPSSTAEWVYYWVNSRIDFTSSTPEAPEGFSPLWGVSFALYGCVAAGLALLVSLEMFLTIMCRLSPLTGICGVVVMALMLIPGCVKTWIDDNLAPYPVLWVYPWQKLYPCAMTAGQWLPFPLDQLWDVVLMMPVHLTRALWDYVSCQDITSPQEVSVLLKRGIINDRLRSLLVSRRSYFIVAVTMGCLQFVINFQSLLRISEVQTHLRQAAHRPQVYPEYYCTITNGTCPIDRPDPASLYRYVLDMTLRLYGIVQEGSNYVDTVQAVILWMGGLLSLTCSVAALAYWTNFSISRRFCIMGWMCMTLTPAMTACISANAHINWAKTETSIVTTLAEVWEDVSLFVGSTPCEAWVETFAYAQDSVADICSHESAMCGFLCIFDGCDIACETCKTFRKLYNDPSRVESMNNILSFCKRSQTLFREGHMTRRDFEEYAKENTKKMVTGIRLFTSIRAGMWNAYRILPITVSMVPALMQGGLMVKNMVPRQTMPSILTTLPWAYTIVAWVEWQVYYQLMNGWLFLIAALTNCFGPMVYYISGKYFDIHQPMDDQQSITLTFRMWYYALILAVLSPKILLIIYIVWFNSFLEDFVYKNGIAWLFTSDWTGVFVLVASALNAYTYTLQAGIDWFVDELVLHHMAAHVPLCIAASSSADEARMLVKKLHTQIDVDSIEEGTYVCGGLSDPTTLTPPKDGAWSHKAMTYSVSLARKDFQTLDAFAEHIRGDNNIESVLQGGRRPWYKWMDHPDRYNGEPGGAIASKQHPRSGDPRLAQPAGKDNEWTPGGSPAQPPGQSFNSDRPVAIQGWGVNYAVDATGAASYPEQHQYGHEQAQRMDAAGPQRAGKRWSMAVASGVNKLRGIAQTQNVSSAVTNALDQSSSAAGQQNYWQQQPFQAVYDQGGGYIQPQVELADYTQSGGGGGYGQFPSAGPGYAGGGDGFGAPANGGEYLGHAAPQGPVGGGDYGGGAAPQGGGAAPYGGDFGGGSPPQGGDFGGGAAPYAAPYLGGDGRSAARQVRFAEPDITSYEPSTYDSGQRPHGASDYQQQSSPQQPWGAESRPHFASDPMHSQPQQSQWGPGGGTDGYGGGRQFRPST